jgi:hypothetical protein
MKQLMKLAAAAALGALASGSIVYAQAGSPEPPRARIALYRAAPGQQVALLKWLAAQDQAAQAAGLPRSQLYAHTDGDSWDYMVIFPQTTPAQDDALDAAAKKMGLPYGPMVGIELRKHIAIHTDTLVRGPMSAAEMLANLGEK